MFNQERLLNLFNKQPDLLIGFLLLTGLNVYCFLKITVTPTLTTSPQLSPYESWGEVVIHKSNF